MQLKYLICAEYWIKMEMIKINLLKAYLDLSDHTVLYSVQYNGEENLLLH